jgi:transcriptional regulator with XRE-family HTH domain
MKAVIAESKGFFVESSSKRTALCFYRDEAHDKEIYFLKQDRRFNNIYDSTVTVKEINGYSITLGSCVKFTDNITDANKIAAKLEKKAIQNSREKERNLARVIGNRLKYSRETLCGISQLKASEKLGISNTLLALLEHGTDGRKPSHETMVKASRLYKVSLDYIYGETEEFETDIDEVHERHIQSWVLNELESQAINNLNITRKIGNRIAVVSNAAKFAIEYAKEIGEAVDTIRKLNPNFDDDIRGGSKLVNRLEYYGGIIDGVKASLERVSEYKKIASKTTGVNFDVFDI